MSGLSDIVRFILPPGSFMYHSIQRGLGNKIQFNSKSSVQSVITFTSVFNENFISTVTNTYNYYCLGVLYSQLL